MTRLASLAQILHNHDPSTFDFGAVVSDLLDFAAALTPWNGCSLHYDALVLTTEPRKHDKSSADNEPPTAHDASSKPNEAPAVNQPAPPLRAQLTPAKAAPSSQL